MSLPDPQLVDVPDLIQPVVGFRQWRLAVEGLLSIAFDEAWRGPTLDARCRLDKHPEQAPPASGCSCGVHAWYEPCPRTASAATRDCISGAVILWGAIELHADGMRAQHCRIVALALPLSHWGKRDRLRGVAARFGVPAVRHRALRRAAAEYGAPVPDGLRLPRQLGVRPLGNRPA